MVADTTLCATYDLSETYRRSKGVIERTVERRDGVRVVSAVRAMPGRPRSLSVEGSGPAAEHDAAWLRGRSVPPLEGGRRVSIVDLFSGCGGLSVGAREAARALGMGVDVRLAVDLASDALDVYEDNFSPEQVHDDDITKLLDGRLGEPLTLSERSLRRRLDGVDLVLGGPPCQGHSSLNNHTRRDDPKNSLYLSMARFAEVTRPEAMVVENVADVVHSRIDVVGRTREVLEGLGYAVSIGVLRAVDIGIPQTRRRHVLVATRRDIDVDLSAMSAQHARPRRSVAWAIADLAANGGGSASAEGFFDTASTPSAVNVERMAYLFEHDLHELPDVLRPDCHRLKPHTYKSVYGRMYAEQPAPTITSGFGSMGQGRYVHPTLPRTITPHEAARLQGFPDDFSFGSAASRTGLSRMIGNAVPSRLAYVPVLELLR